MPAGSPVPIRTCSILIALIAGLFVSCGRGNPWLSDLNSLLQDRGITLEPVRHHAPISERAGFVVVKHDVRLSNQLIAGFELRRMPVDDRGWLIATERVRGPLNAKEVWGITARPAQLKLKDGGQFEYMYLVITPDGDLYLFAEYAYG